MEVVVYVDGAGVPALHVYPEPRPGPGERLRNRTGDLD
jgi:hypothetical protein